MKQNPKLTGRQRAELDRLEKVDELSAYQRGQLIAWSLWSSQEDAHRAKAILQDHPNEDEEATG